MSSIQEVGITITAIVFVASYFLTSYKAGYLLVVSPKSVRAIWEVKKDKIIPFILAVCSALVIFSFLFYVVLDSFENKNFYIFINMLSVTLLFLHSILLKSPVKIRDKKDLRKINER